MELDSAREIAYDAPRLRKLNMNMGDISPRDTPGKSPPNEG
ncbi:hypothetical protein [Aliiroseovarius crassostreae]